MLWQGARVDLIRGGKRAVPVLIALLTGPGRKELVRVHAARVLRSIGGPAVPALRKVVGDSGCPVEARIPAAQVLAWASPAEKDKALATAARLAAGMLESERDEVRLEAAVILHELGKDARPAVPALNVAAGDPVSAIRNAAVLTLAAQGPSVEETVPGLVRAIQAGGPLQIQVVALTALEKMGPAAKEALPALERIARENDDAVIRDLARSAIERIRK